MISHEDKKDVARVLGAKTAKKVAHATDDSKSKALRLFKSSKERDAYHKEHPYAASHPYSKGPKLKPKGAPAPSKYPEKAKALKRAIPEVSKREENKVLKSVQKKGYYASPAAQKALKKSKQDQDRFSKERAERYKREGLS